MMVECQFKTNGRPSVPVVCPPRQLVDLTADCLFEALVSSLPQLQLHEFGRDFGARWSVLILVADDASSNRRLIAYLGHWGKG
eukprot:2691212-Pyramimonas_sp.AAC.1